VSLECELEKSAKGRQVEYIRCTCLKSKVEEPIPDTLRFRATKESKLDMKKSSYNVDAKSRRNIFKVA
jgi:hypothetical protein